MAESALTSVKTSSIHGFFITINVFMQYSKIFFMSACIGH